MPQAPNSQKSVFITAELIDKIIPIFGEIKIKQGMLIPCLKNRKVYK